MMNFCGQTSKSYFDTSKTQIQGKYSNNTFFEDVIEILQAIGELSITSRDGQNHHILMILKSKSNHLNKGDLKSKSKSF